MEWLEKLEYGMEKVTGYLTTTLKELIVADDRPPNWRIRFRINNEKEWRGIDGQKTGNARSDTEDKT